MQGESAPSGRTSKLLPLPTDASAGRESSRRFRLPAALRRSRSSIFYPEVETSACCTVIAALILDPLARRHLHRNGDDQRIQAMDGPEPSTADASCACRAIATFMTAAHPERLHRDYPEQGFARGPPGGARFAMERRDLVAAEQY